MSKEELVKLNVMVDFKCIPELEVINLNEEVENNKIISNNKKELFEIGKISCSMNFFSSNPFWGASIVLRKKDLTKELFIEKSKELYHNVLEIINEAKDMFFKNVNDLKIPDNDYFINRYNNKINDSFWKEMPLSKFKEIIMEKSFEEWNKKFEHSSIDKNKYNNFIKSNLTEQKLDEIIDNFKVLKIKNNNVYFNDKKDYESLIKNIVNFIVDSLVEVFFDILEQNN